MGSHWGWHDWETYAAIVIFFFVWAMVARNWQILPIGRTAGALLGAVLMVSLGILRAADANASIELGTLMLLLGLMLILGVLEGKGTVDVLTNLLLIGQVTPLGLLIRVSMLSGFLAAFIMNDGAALFLSMVLIRLCDKYELPLKPYMIAMATSSNIGSAATVLGNPKNMVIHAKANIDFMTFITRIGPASLLGLILNTALVTMYFYKDLTSATVAYDHATDAGLGSDGDDDDNSDDIHAGADAVSVTHQLRLLSRTAALSHAHATVPPKQEKLQSSKQHQMVPLAGPVAAQPSASATTNANFNFNRGRKPSPTTGALGAIDETTPLNPIPQSSPAAGPLTPTGSATNRLRRSPHMPANVTTGGALVSPRGGPPTTAGTAYDISDQTFVLAREHFSPFLQPSAGGAHAHGAGASALPPLGPNAPSAVSLGGSASPRPGVGATAAPASRTSSGDKNPATATAAPSGSVVTVATPNLVSVTSNSPLIPFGWAASSPNLPLAPVESAGRPLMLSAMFDWDDLDAKVAARRAIDESGKTVVSLGAPASAAEEAEAAAAAKAAKKAKKAKEAEQKELDRKRREAELVAKTPGALRQLWSWLSVGANRANVGIACVIFGMYAGFLFDYDLGWTCLCAAMLTLVLERSDPTHLFQQINYQLLIYISALFVTITGINQTPIASLFWDAIYPLLQPGTSLTVSVFGFTILCFVLCLVFTSIPCVLLVAPHLIELSGPLSTFAWLLLAWCVTLCGNVTIFSSVAGVIVSEYATAAMEPISFMEWVRYAVPSTIVIVACGAVVITFENQWLGAVITAAVAGTAAGGTRMSGDAKAANAGAAGTPKRKADSAAGGATAPAASATTDSSKRVKTDSATAASAHAYDAGEPPSFDDEEALIAAAQEAEAGVDEAELAAAEYEAAHAAAASKPVVTATATAVHSSKGGSTKSISSASASVASGSSFSSRETVVLDGDDDVLSYQPAPFKPAATASPAAVPAPASKSSGSGGGGGGSGVCYKCNQPGHWARDCPGASASAGKSASSPAAVGSTGAGAGSAQANAKCYNCNQIGHYSSRCPLKTGGAAVAPAPASGGSGGGGGAANATCYNCKQVGHYSSNCPAKAGKASSGGGGAAAPASAGASSGGGGGGGGAANATCYNCKQIGHYSSSCPLKKGAPVGGGGSSGGGSSGGGGGASSSVCFKCQKPGHFSRDCPNAAKSGGSGGGGGGGGGSKCFSCGDSTHWSRDCPNKRKY